MLEAGQWGPPSSPHPRPGRTLRQCHGDRLLLKVWQAASCGDLLHQLPDGHSVLPEGLPWGHRGWEMAPSAGWSSDPPLQRPWERAGKEGGRGSPAMVRLP